MTNIQPPGQQDTMANTLSAEAKEFVPRQFADTTGFSDPGTSLNGSAGVYLDDNGIPQTSPLNGLPSYITTCYPFVASGENRFTGIRPRFRGKYPQQAMYMPQHFQPMQQGIPRNQFPSPGKGYIPTSSWGMPAVTDMFSHYNLHNGMPFDGGTYQNGYIHTSLPQGSEHNGKPMMSPVQPTTSGDGYSNSGHLVNGYSDPVIKPKWKNKKKTREKTSSGDSAKSSKQITYKSSMVQTDFPESIANATLEESPNTLFNTGTSMHKNQDDLESSGSARSRHSSENTVVSAYSDSSHKQHRHNTVSNGTNPHLNFSHTLLQQGLMTDHMGGHMTSCDFTESSSAYSMPLGAFPVLGAAPSIENSGYIAMQCCQSSMVPYVDTNFVNANSVPFKPSYASIAQTKASQWKASDDKHKSVKNKSDQSNCDKNRNKEKRGDKHISKGSSNVTARLTVNVADIMQDLERADSGLIKSTSEVSYRAPSQVESFMGKSLYSSAVKVQGQSVDNAISGKTKSSDSQGQTNLQCHSQGKGQKLNSSHVQVKGQSGHSDLDLNKSDLDIERKGQGQSQSDNNNNNQDASADGKKKRRRRRRRKKKMGESENDDLDGAKEEITLHFEDEEEFPDLSGARESDNVKSSPTGPAIVSYSEALSLSTPVQSLKPATEEQLVTSENEGASLAKESRTSRKRRKRRECANKAADAEMAEINLEQHMLELKMKQKLPLSAKKSVSPVRNTATQGVWKLTPSSPTTQPSSTGKKVSLLLPGTIASEPSHNATPHQPNTSAVKQPGILKVSQSQTQNTSQSGGKKSKQPITYDLGAMIDALESKKEKTPPPKKEVKSAVVKKTETKPMNLLDSSAPSQKRGKERETPKTKKPSPLKKVILKEREEKKRLRLLDDEEVASGIGMIPATAFPNSPISAPIGIGVVSGESDLSQDGAASFKGSMDVGLGTPASAELSPISQQSPSCMSPMSPGASPLSSGVDSPLTGTIQQTVKLKIHSRRFREYCNQVLDKDIDNHVTALLQDLVRFQDKQYHKDPVKAKAKRRFVLGLREVTKHLKLKKIKCVIISPNLEKIQSKGGLDDALNLILELCNEQKVPFIFALGRRALGRACAKLVPVSVVGIFNYEGSEENFKSLVMLTEKAREQYREMIVQIEKEIAEHPPRTHTPGVPHIFAHMGHSRTPSGCSVISFTSSILSEPISENYPQSEPETDNRGYEIEKDDDQLDSDINQNQDERDDPYEADDERGYKPRKAKNIYVRQENGRVQQSEVGNDLSESRVNENDVQEFANTVEELENTGDELEYNHLESPRSKDQVDVSIASNEDTSVPVETQNGDGLQDTDDDESEDNDSDFDTCESNNDADNAVEENDVVDELPRFIDSVHHFDLNEILSQHSSKTMENGEDVMSTHSSKTTHSSRTVGDSSGLNGEKAGKILDLKSVEKSGNLGKSKSGVDKKMKEHRTMSWVKEAQSLHFGDQVDQRKEPEENAMEVNSVGRECLDAVA